MTNFVNRIKSKFLYFLLKEDRGYLLLENGFKIIITDYSFSNRTKNITDFSNRKKNITNFFYKNKS